MALASVYKKYALINERLARGEEWFFSLSNTGSEVTRCPGRRSRKMKYPKIGIFIGSGTSHSWLWFVDLFDRMGFHNLDFLDESAVQKGSLAAVDVLAVSGGDTFAICKALGPSGAREIKAFIEKGGLYIGSCAGAYLPMNSSKTHLHNFNFAAVKITNLSKLLPGCLQLEHKFATAYGCNYIFHPVREAVTLNPTDLEEDDLRYVNVRPEFDEYRERQYRNGVESRYGVDLDGDGHVDIELDATLPGYLI